MKRKNLFHQKVAIITGAANGLGKALAILLARKECHLALLDIDAANLKKTGLLLDGYAINYTLHPVDVAQSEKVAEVREEILTVHKSIQFLFNCAGVSVTAPFLEQPKEDLHWLMGVNFFGSLNTCRAFLPELLKQEQSHILNVSSGLAFQGLPNRTAYTSSKYAIRGFSEALRAELFHTNVNVSCAFPGPIKTGMPDRSRVTDIAFLKKEIKYLAANGYDPEWVARVMLVGVSKNKSEILIGRQVRMAVLLKRLLPRFMSRIVGKYQNRLPV